MLTILALAVWLRQWKRWRRRSMLLPGKNVLVPALLPPLATDDSWRVTTAFAGILPPVLPIALLSLVSTGK